jgi:glycosyltransferase involved in cell wall biosynthesis
MADVREGAETRDLSIVTLTYNNFTDRGATLPILFSGLERQELPAGTELVVVDDGSDDRTPAFVRREARRVDAFDVRLVETPHTGNQCENRNAGVEAASGDLLFFFDDDTVPLGDDYVRTALDCWAPGHFLCGAQRYWSPPQWDEDAVRRRVDAGEWETLKEWAHLPTGAIKRRTGSRSLQEYTFVENFGLVAREDVERVGGLDEDYEEWGHGDTDLMLRLLLDGVDFVNVHDAVEALHLNTPLGFPRGAGNTNSDVFHRKLDELGVDFDVASLYDLPAGEHRNVVMAQDGVDDPDLEAKTVRIRRPGESSTGEPVPDHVGAGAASDAAENDRVDGPAISVVVPTHDAFRDRRGAIRPVVRALEQQTAPEFEVVVVDDGSDDETPAFLDRFAERSPLDVSVVDLDPHTGNRSLARNRGAERASNDLLVFLDDDTVPLSTDSLATVAERYEPGHFLCGARTYWTSAYEELAVVEDAVERGDYRSLAAESVRPRGISRRDGYRSLRGYSFVGRFGAVGADDFARVGGFDADAFDGWGKEDEDLMARLYRAGVSFTSLVDDVSVLHVNNPVSDDEFEYRETLVDRYRERERDRGERFRPTRLFGASESDGTAVLEPVDE